MMYKTSAMKLVDLLRRYKKKNNTYNQLTLGINVEHILQIP